MKKILTAFAFVFFGTVLSAQTASEIAAARSMAKQYGYSEEEINAIMNKEGVSTEQQEPAKKKIVSYGIPDQALPGDLDYLGFQVPITVEPVDSLAEKTNIFGHDFFVSKGLSLIPSVTAPVPESYVLGPGDDLNISVWGATSASYDLTIRSDGSVIIPSVGPVSVSGRTLASVEKMLRSKLSEYFPGLSDKSSGLQVTVGRIRGVSVYVLGEVKTPGVFTLPSLCNIPTAIYMAGGIRPLGSVRKINLFRGGKKVDTFDLYDFIYNGTFNPVLKLQDGDIISSEVTGPIVAVSGEVKRAKRFEMAEGETIADLIKYSGGFTSSARCDIVHIDRISPNGGTAFDVPAELFKSFQLQDGDEISIKKGDTDRLNRVSITGNVVNEGYFAISDKLKTVKELISAAGGLKEGTFMKRAYIDRLNEDRIPVRVSFSLRDIVDGVSDINLVRDDEVVVYSNLQLIDSSMVVTIFGEINGDGDYPFREGMTVGDLLLLAGGPKDGADLSKVEVAVRGRENDPVINTYDLVNDDAAMNVQLHPYDKVYVKSLENYRDLKTIRVIGEVKYPGYYAVEKGNVRLSDIVARTSGFTDDAYIPGARLKRKMQESEVETAEFIQRIAAMNDYKVDTTLSAAAALDKLKKSAEYDEDSEIGSQLDSLQKESRVKAGDYYTISVDLQAAIDNPGTDADLVLRDEDILEVPQMNNTVKISGGVYLPNVVAYNPNFGWRDYIGLAGGFVKGARRSKIYAVYQDGSSAVRGSSRFKMEPGMELVVPQVEKSEKHKLTAGEWAALASAVTSVTSIVVILVNQLNRY